MTMKTGQPKTYGMQPKQFQREVYSKTSLPQETGNISNKQPNLKPKAIRQRGTTTTTKPHIQQNEINHKDQIRNK